MKIVFDAIQQGVLYGLLAIGIYVAFRILNIPDLTTEGSFTMGLAVSAMCTYTGHPWLGIVLGIVGGFACGTVTGILQTSFEIHPILAGILTMSATYTINLLILGNSPSLQLLGKDTVFTYAREFLALFGFDSKDGSKMVVIAIVAIIVAAIAIWFFKTRLGLCVRAVGDNEAMVSASSINVKCVKIIAIALSNGCIALCGAVITQYQNYADINSGTGTLVVGLASVIIGETLIGKRGVTAGIISAVVGSVIYRLILAFAMRYMSFPASALKLVSAIIVALALAIPVIKKKAALMKQRMGGEKDA
ncbi:MAG: ABC transporter permease [Clostridia bacterium]|nr:ABC transporter permease [Clostridia bacterium]